MSEENMSQPEITNEEFSNEMDKEINREPSFPEEMMRSLREKFTVMKDKYANGNKEEQALLEADVVQTGERISKAEMFKTNLASLLSSNSDIGHNPTFKLAEYTNDMLNIVNGNNKPTYDENVPGYKLHDGWKSMEDIEKLVQGRYVDKASRELFTTIVQDQQKLASEIQPGENAEFNWQKAHNTVKTKIIEQGDIRSLATDKIFGNRVFQDDLLSAIQSGTYGELGLDEETIKSMDPTPDGKISTEDAAQITSGILQDGDMLKEYLTDNYVKAMEQNFYDILIPDVRKAQENKTNKSQQTQESATSGKKPTPSWLKGGTIVDGKFVPSKQV